MDAQTEWDWWSSATPWFLILYTLLNVRPLLLFIYLMAISKVAQWSIDPSLLMPSSLGNTLTPKHGLEWPSSYHVTLTTGDWTSGWTLETDTVSLSPGQWPTQLSCLKIWANGHKDHGQSLMGVRLVTSCWVQRRVNSCYLVKLRLWESRNH